MAQICRHRVPSITFHPYHFDLDIVKIGKTLGATCGPCKPSSVAVRRTDENSLHATIIAITRATVVDAKSLQLGVDRAAITVGHRMRRTRATAKGNVLRTIVYRPQTDV